MELLLGMVGVPEGHSDVNGKRNAWESNFIPFLYFSKMVRAWCQCWVVFLLLFFVYWFVFPLHLKRVQREACRERAARKEGWRLVNERAY